MSLGVRENGIHSLVEALKAFKIFHEKPDDPNRIFALKDSILRAQHALETLFKDVLFNYNPVLLLEENKKVVFKGRYSVSVCSLLCYGSLGVSC